MPWRNTWQEHRGPDLEPDVKLRAAIDGETHVPIFGQVPADGAQQQPGEQPHVFVTLFVACRSPGPSQSETRDAGDIHSIDDQCMELAPLHRWFAGRPQYRHQPVARLADELH